MRGDGPRCPRCALPPQVCFCAGLVPVEVQTPIAVICHEKELKKPSSSGVFARLAVRGLRLMVRRDPEIVAHVEDQRRAGRTPVLLYPDSLAVPLASIEGPVALYVAEGNWRQARKVGLREAPFPEVQHAFLPPVPPRRRLRRHPKADHLATMEAIGHAVRIVEDEAMGAEILRTYDRFVDAVAILRRWGDGDSVAGDDGLPENT